VDAAAYLAERGPEVDAALDRWLPPADAPPAALHAAMRHLLFPGGKRLRPALAFAGAEAVGAPHARALPIAVAVELVHTYSLVHDDLPCMDDDAERRGQPTVHVLYGEATAVLAGDALLAAAFEYLARAAVETPVSAEARRSRAGPSQVSAVARRSRAGPSQGLEAGRVAAALRDLAQAAGSRALVGGQADDLDFPRDANAAAVESVHARKTAALFAAAVVGGGRLGGGDGAALERLRRFAEATGVAFQIADDWLDRAGDEPCSLVRVLGADAARARADALLAEALEAVEPFGARAEPLRELARFAVGRDR
jgi:geranylgeranyl diphosphate synthase type II